jgi:chemotaxis protein CheZ
MQLVYLLLDSGPKVTNSAEAENSVPTAVAFDTHKLVGPQTTDAALKQNDMDDLLASFGF